MYDLKPCPACGSQLVKEVKKKGKYRFECNGNCWTTTHWHWTKEDAAKEWNTLTVGSEIVQGAKFFPSINRTVYWPTPDGVVEGFCSGIEVSSTAVCWVGDLDHSIRVPQVYLTKEEAERAREESKNSG